MVRSLPVTMGTAARAQRAEARRPRTCSLNRGQTSAGRPAARCPASHARRRKHSAAGLGHTRTAKATGPQGPISPHSRRAQSDATNPTISMYSPRPTTDTKIPTQSRSPGPAGSDYENTTASRTCFIRLNTVQLSELNGFSRWPNGHGKN